MIFFLFIFVYLIQYVVEYPDLDSFTNSFQFFWSLTILQIILSSMCTVPECLAQEKVCLRKIIKTLREILTIWINTTSSSLFIADNTFLGQSPSAFAFSLARFVHRGTVFLWLCPLLHVHTFIYFQLLDEIKPSDNSHINIYPDFIKIQFVSFLMPCFPFNRLLFIHHSFCRYLSIPGEIWECFKNGFLIDGVFGSHHV